MSREELALKNSAVLSTVGCGGDFDTGVEVGVTVCIDLVDADEDGWLTSLCAGGDEVEMGVVMKVDGNGEVVVVVVVDLCVVEVLAFVLVVEVVLLVWKRCRTTRPLGSRMS